MSWKKYIEEYEIFLKFEKNLSENTYHAYIQDINKLVQFIEIVEKNLYPENIKIEHLRSFTEWLNGFGLSPRSQARIVSGIKSFFKFLELEELIEENPASLLSAPEIGRKLPEVLSTAEIDTIIDAIDVSTALGHRNRAIIEVLYSCGLRVSELTNLKISNIFYTQEFIKVTGKGDKQRLIPLGSKARKEIDNYMKSFRNHVKAAEGHRDYLFLNRRGKKLTRVMIFTIIKETCKLAGIKKNISPHTFRHSFATHLIDGGADLRVVQEMLGHESITTTEIYTHLDTSYLKDTILMYHPRS